jgi:hypothetical protein
MVIVDISIGSLGAVRASKAVMGPECLWVNALIPTEDFGSNDHCQRLGGTSRVDLRCLRFPALEPTTNLFDSRLDTPNPALGLDDR